MNRFLLALTVLAVAAPAAAQNPYSDRLAQYDALHQKSSLRRAILAEKQRCPTIIAAARQQPYQNLVMWTARCSNADYAVFIGPDGTVQVRPCADLKKLGLPQCRIAAARKP